MQQKQHRDCNCSALKVLNSNQKEKSNGSFWKSKKSCHFRDQICFDEILFSKCYRQHSEANIQEMKRKWGDLKHEELRKLKSKQPQTNRDCPSGINCYYLVKGNCLNGHSAFDWKFALNVRKSLFQTECPAQKNGKSCLKVYCYYSHSNDILNEMYKEDCQVIEKYIQEGGSKKQQKKPSDKEQNTLEQDYSTENQHQEKISNETAKKTTKKMGIMIPKQKWERKSRC